MLRTAEQYKESLKDGRAVYLGGERVKDVTTHPILQIPVDHSAEIYRLAEIPELTGLFTAPLEGEPVSRYFLIPKSGQDLLLRRDLIEETTRRCGGTLNIVKAIGSDALFALTLIAARMDRELGTSYVQRVETYLRYCRQKDLALAVAQTDVKGDRSLRPHQQPDPDLYLRVVDRRADGIVVRGAKAHTTQGPVVNEIIAIPTRAMGEEDKEYAVAVAVPANTKGLKFICRPTIPAEASLFDNPVSRRYIETESLTVFEDVFVPWERVFLCGEWPFAGPLAITFATFHRFTAVSYKPPIGDLFIGAAQLIAEMNGVDKASHIREKIAKLITYTEIIRACGKAAALDCQIVEGIAVPNPTMTNVGKYHFASQFHEAIALLQDIAGGLSITVPSEKELRNPETRAYLEKYLVGRSGFKAEDRLKVFHLIRDLTASDFGGYNLVVSLHGEGSQQAQLITTYRDYDLERCKRLVKELLNIP